MTRVERLAQAILEPISPTLIVVLGLHTMLWGLWILSPFWNVFDHAPLYGVMAGLSSEYVWGSIAIVSGLFVLRGAYKPSVINIKVGAFIGSLHWFIISLLYFAGDWESTGGVTSLTFSVLYAVLWANTTINNSKIAE